MKIEIHEKTVNNFLRAFGTIKSSKKIDTYFYKGRLFWRIENLRVSFNPGGATFRAQAKVRIDKFSYKPILRGKIYVLYRAKTNKVLITPHKALIQIYIKFKGKKIHLGYLNIARFLKFELDGPKGVGSGMRIRLPNRAIKKIHVHSVDSKIVFFEQRLIFFSNLRYKPKR